jgi:hypothetical protein
MFRANAAESVLAKRTQSHDPATATCVLSFKIALSASCPGLTRASMMTRNARRPYKYKSISDASRHCRVKPGNDEREAATATT